MGEMNKSEDSKIIVYFYSVIVCFLLIYSFKFLIHSTTKPNHDYQIYKHKMKFKPPKAKEEEDINHVFAQFNKTARCFPDCSNQQKIKIIYPGFDHYGLSDRLY